MSTYSPIEYTDSLCIGTVDFISPDEVKVLLDIDAPEAVSLNTGFPRPFPRVNDYVLIPSNEGHVVGQIEWLAIEHSPHPKRKGMHDFGLIDLPYPMRKVSLNPVGVLTSERQGVENERVYELRRGVNSFPSVGTQVLLPTQEQFRAIIESGEGKKVKIGTSPLADSADVRVSPDRLFGRHLAVLGNTGSGKSCSVAGIIRWSLDAAQKVLKSEQRGKLNARFIVLDPNGEYSRAFRSGGNHSNIKARIFKVDAGDGEENLHVPLWFWNSAEWSAFTQATAKTQRPALVHALRNVRDGALQPSVTQRSDMRRFLRTMVNTITAEKSSGAPWGIFPKPKSFFEKLEKWLSGGLKNDSSFSDDQNSSMDELKNHLDALIAPRKASHSHFDFTKEEIDDLLENVRKTYFAFGGSERNVLPLDADTPREFSGKSFLQSLDASAEVLNVSEYVETLFVRIQTILDDTRMKSIMDAADDVTLAKWLSDYLGETDSASEGDGQVTGENITVIDLSLVPSEIIHIITAVVSRMIFEALQHYRNLNKRILPTVMVVEEAHTFVKRYKEDAENQDAASVCCQVFEKIAREGRKFGLGLVVSSQRPSELSPTVLSQCNTFLLHRISNDRDQDLVRRFIPDNLKGLLRELPSLPSQHAILMGWASELPLLVKMNDLPKEQQPQSDDPDFWDVWTGAIEQAVDWNKIADDWQGKESAVGQQESGNKGNQGKSPIEGEG